MATNVREQGFPCPVLDVGLWEEVFVTFVNSPTSFYCQFARSASDLEHLMSQIGAYCSRPDTGQIHSPTLGQPCLAQYSEDKQWYRAIVTGVLTSTRQYQVQFVDYGNTDNVDQSQIKNVPASFMTLPRQAFWCTLNGILPSEPDVWTDEEIDAFYNMTLDQTELVCIYAYDNVEDQYIVEMFDGKVNLNEKLGGVIGRPVSMRQHVGTPRKPTQLCPGSLVASTKANSQNLNIERLDLKVNDYVDVHVSFTDSPSCFWCQLVRRSEDLENLMDQLNAEYGAMRPGECTLTKLIPEQICCVKFSEDGNWYRGRIICLTGKQILVHFVDYGNQEKTTADNLKVLAEKYANRLPAQAFRCSLTGLQPVDGEWSLEAMSQFEEVTAKKKKVPTATLR